MLEEHKKLEENKESVLELKNILKETSGTSFSSSTPLQLPEAEGIAEKKETVVSKEWKQLLEFSENATLPPGMPVRWDKTKEMHQRLAFNPRTNETWNLKENQFTKAKSSTIGFITLTKGQNPMPGSETPAAPRVELYNQLQLRDCLCTDAARNQLAPCLAHGDYVKVQSLALDHATAWSEILKRQEGFVAKLNTDHAFAAFIMAQPGMDKFFVKIDDIYYGTVFFYELYFNDIDNLWLICQACNTDKRDGDVLAWLENQWLYGKEFLEYVATVGINKAGFQDKLQTKEGLAQAIIIWFWKRHATYLSTVKSLQENIVVPVQILNIKVDHVYGSGNLKRAERLQASIDFRVKLLSKIAQMTGLKMPRPGNESPSISSDEEQWLRLSDGDGSPLKLTMDHYKEAARETIDFIPLYVAQTLKTNVKLAIQRSKKNDDKSSHSTIALDDAKQHGTTISTQIKETDSKMDVENTSSVVTSPGSKKDNKKTDENMISVDLPSPKSRKNDKKRKREEKSSDKKDHSDSDSDRESPEKRQKFNSTKQ
jgi:hypothetical protein